MSALINEIIQTVKNVRLIQTTAKLEMFENKWRVKMGLTHNPNTESPLTYLPDFTYMDGRPSPIGVSQVKFY